jgi:hypothetical protein
MTSGLEAYYMEKRAKYLELMAQEIVNDLGVNVAQKGVFQDMLQRLKDGTMELSDIARVEGGGFEEIVRQDAPATNGVKEAPKQPAMVK